ncbi:hypothetical protein HNP37_004731 [Flavobacterium nitrogenifigens]|uniref:Uncharacterized protein n=2 Tax=Flavobacterium TaxID=237 RepID=A0A7W7NAL2_9FLAO|nr:hypothetical protein [Flavobacterium nitrogenifigens]MBB6389593.1 hypothetical protein [Flavobacterium notoginsengisoli]
MSNWKQYVSVTSIKILKNNYAIGGLKRESRFGSEKRSDL